ncbi:MAG: DUF1738 domain-containing protein [Bacteroidetes bacterium]|mgnify:CR=1 FL=1|nr:MAG: DUF1738 domain-containing protein [Bacteroidota bacterium]REK06581.1 MAG: DUF1738 domain-containing protein [Bacteroidota bacterium]REK33347.1 MAG: DUF1738 domain-containing protein [Bacteroidota bacterium]REK49747.1 MAG: DUF1738 domain-containing protein [Bacteroidota bacterium]
MKTNNRPRPDVYKMVTERIISALEKGVVPWQQPWRNSGLPQNLITGKVYRGINLWLLLSLGYSRNFFLSEKQLEAIGGKVKEGEKANIIVFWKQITIDDPDTTETKDYPFLRYYRVFNVEQCEGIPEDKLSKVDETIHNDIVSCEDVYEQMPKKPKLQHKGDKAFYNPLLDFINMPAKTQFPKIEDYYSVLFHELIHSTGHLSRLNRKELLNMSEFGSEPYSIEELVAEIGCCFLKTVVGIGNNDLENNTAYIDGWLKSLKNDHKFIVFASSQAQKATDYILNTCIQKEDESITETDGGNDSTF